MQRGPQLLDVDPADIDDGQTSRVNYILYIGIWRPRLLSCVSHDVVVEIEVGKAAGIPYARKLWS